jgi:BRCT domain type II-containing protein
MLNTEILGADDDEDIPAPVSGEDTTPVPAHAQASSDTTVPKLDSTTTFSSSASDSSSH